MAGWQQCSTVQHNAGMNVASSRLSHMTPPVAARCCPAQVLHARTCTASERQLIHLVAACHLIFSVGCDNMLLALYMLPPLRLAGGAGGAGVGGAAAAGKGGGATVSGWGLPSSDSTSSLASSVGGGGAGGRALGPGGRSR